MKGFVLTFVLTIFLATSGDVSASPPRQADFEVVTVVGVVDGDTIDVRFEDGRTERVRYVGMNTPENSELCSGEATQANTSLVGGKTVMMFRDVSNTDGTGRLLRYVFTIDGTFVNAALVAGGWAEAAEYPPDVTFAGYFGLLEQIASSNGLGCHPTGVFAGTLAPTPTISGLPALPSRGQPTLPAEPGFTCDCRKPCTQMASCEEAYFQLQQCGCTARDQNGDGVPCESICPGGKKPANVNNGSRRCQSYFDTANPA